MPKPKKRYQKKPGVNPALRHKIIEQSIVDHLNNAREEGITWGCLGFEVLSLMVLHDKFNITDKDELKRYVKEMSSLSDCITNDYATLSDFIRTLKEESGFTLSEEDIMRIDPGLAGMLEDTDSKKMT